MPKIAIQVIVEAPIADVWRAYTSPHDIQQWNAASDDWHTTSATVDLRKGGAFSYRMEAKDGSAGFDFAGIYTVVDENSRLEYDFGSRTAQVEFSQTPRGVLVKLTFDSDPTHSLEQQQAGWQAILDNFARHVGATR